MHLTVKKFLFFVLATLFLTSTTNAQTPFELRYQHNGRYDFTGIGATLNAVENTSATSCDDYNLPTPPTVPLNLDPGQTIVAAYLYWSANTESFDGSDTEVTLNGIPVTADRAYTTRVNSGSTYDFFSCVSDVTSIVQSIGNGNYTVDNLDVYRGDCTVSYGGWAMTIVFEDPTFTSNTVNIYDGFRVISGNNGEVVNITVTDILVSQQIGSFVGMLAWEGDSSLSNSEVLEFNGNRLSNALNPEDNAFNSTNTFSNNNQFYNMDFDRYNIESYVNAGDSSAEFEFSSGADLVLVNQLVFTLNSELPDPTVEITDFTSPVCDLEEIDLELTVRNTNSNKTLPAGTSVKVYIDDTSNPPEVELFTTTNIPIDAEEILTTTIPMPAGNPTAFDIIVTINLDENGEVIELELNSNNNTDEINYVPVYPPTISLDDQEACELTSGNEVGEFDIDQIIADYLTANPGVTFEIYEDQASAEAGGGGLSGTYNNTSNPQTLVGKQITTSNNCVSYAEFELRVLSQPVANTATLEECSNGTSATFTLSEMIPDINNSADVTITFYATEAEAIAGDDMTNLPNEFTTPTATIWARVENDTTGCFNTVEVKLEVIATPTLAAISDYQICENDGDEIEQFDLETKLSEIYGTQNPADFSVSFHTSQAGADDGSIDRITNTSSYENLSNPQLIYVRVENNLNSTCFTTGTFDLVVSQIPEANDVPILVPICSSGTTASFNLTEVELDIAAGNADMDVTFYEDAALTSLITDPSNYASGSTTVYGLVTNPETGCTNVGNVSLTVLAEPSQNPQRLEECATNSSNNEASFNLESIVDAIIDNQQNVTVTFHTNYSDADSNTNGGVNPITGITNFTTSSTTIFARSEANFNGTICHSVSEVELSVNAKPQAIETTYQLCSSTTEQEFILNTYSDDIANQLSDRIVRFFADETAATSGDVADELPNSYTTASTTVIARVENTITGCFELVDYNLEVIANPTISETIEVQACRKNGIATFNLGDEIRYLEQQYPNYEFAFFETNQFITQLPDLYESEETSIYLRINVNGTDCYTTQEVPLSIEQIPIDDRGTIVICLNSGYTLPNGEQVFEAGVYERMIGDRDSGCDRLTVTNLIIGEVLFPNTFAPNNNGHNDVFRAIPSQECVGDVTDYHLTIFNRWGEKVFETTNFTQGWNGMFNGEISPSDLYVWHATYTFQGENFEKNGSVKLMR